MGVEIHAENLTGGQVKPVGIYLVDVIELLKCNLSEMFCLFVVFICLIFRLRT